MRLVVRDDIGAAQGRSLTQPPSDRQLLAEIGRDLKSVYRDVLKEPLPEHLAALVRKLEGRTRTPDA